MSSRRMRVYWLCQIVGWSAWTAIGILYSISYEAPSRAWWTYALTSSCMLATELAWSHGYRALIRRRGWLGLGPARVLPRALLASVVLGVVMSYSATPAYAFAYPDEWELVGRWTLPAIMSQSLCVLGWSFAYFAIHYSERWQKSEVDKLQLAVAASESQLNGLMAQLNPHFLFNCLNSVRALISEDPAKAQAAVTALSELMRYSLQREVTVPLAAELDMVKTYLSLEAIRYDERLHSELTIADDARDVPVPTMLVQALVENGVKHGIETLPDGGTIAVAAWRADGALRVRVTNPGAIRPRAGSTRVGLANARERLRLLYGGRAELALREDGGAVVAELSLPLEAACGS